MRLFIVSVLSMITLSMPAWAVRTKDCPQQIKFELSDLVMGDVDDIKKQASDWLEPEQIDQAIEVAKKFFQRETYAGRLTLVSKEDSVCRYARYGTATRAKFYTKDGKDKIRFALPLPRDTRDVGVYLTIKSYGKDQPFVYSPESASIDMELTHHDHKYTEFNETATIGKAKLVFADALIYTN